MACTAPEEYSPITAVLNLVPSRYALIPQRNRRVTVVTTCDNLVAALVVPVKVAGNPQEVSDSFS